MCPAFWRGAEPLALMGTVDREPDQAHGVAMPLDPGKVSLDPSIDRRRHHTFYPSLPGLPGCSSRHRHGPEVLLTHHHRPADTRHLVGQGDSRHFAMLGLEQLRQLWVLSGALAVQHRHGAVHQQTAQITVAPLADRAKLRLAARAVLPGRQAQRGGEVAPTPEYGRVDHCGRHGARQIGP